jgi:hypothetical protein
MSETREAWLIKAIVELKAGVFKHSQVPDVKVSVGLPKGKSTAIGQHWSPEASDDKRGSIFISPVLDKADHVLATLAHELVHSVVGNHAGHGPAFRKIAKAIGLTGKMRATVAGPDLILELNKITEKIGAYPHSKLNLNNGPSKKQTTRMIKMQCPECEYIAIYRPKCKRDWWHRRQAFKCLIGGRVF